MHLSKDWLDFLECLKETQVRFLIVGGIAVIHHGYPRTTGDLDIFYEPTRGNVERLLQALRSFFQEDLSLTREELMTAGKVIQLGLPPNRIDLMNHLTGVTFSEAWSSRVQVNFEPINEVPMIGRSVLVKNKKAVGRHRDQEDLEVLDF